MDNLYSPPDVDEAHVRWGANCGPCALAALLSRPVGDLRELFPYFATGRRYVNPTDMKAALDALAVRWETTRRVMQPATGERVAMPTRGLAFLQIDGPWCQPGKPIAAAYRHTHWVGVCHGWVYDANAREWLTPGEWEADVVPHVLAHTRGATGWWPRAGLELYLGG